MKPRVMIVDDEPNMGDLIVTDLKLRDLDPIAYTSAEDSLHALESESIDVVLTDLKMPGIDGIELCERIAANRPDVPVVVMTAFGTLETAVAAIRAGAYDFVTKPIEMDILALTLKRAIDHRQMQEQIRQLSDVVQKSTQHGDLLGASPAMQRLYDELPRVAASDASVLITGESGTGKELVARSLHHQSSRKDAPFVAVNCAAFPDTLLESELFGHVKGAFTDAAKDRKGLFLQAQGGTLFLDEIGEMPVEMQPKLLRALEESQIRPVGGDQEIGFDVRLVAATNRDLETAVDEGRFREDLFFRVNVIQLALPPLRARGTDTLLLAREFLSRFATRAAKNVEDLSDPVAERLLNYSWPGNVRELRNVIERAVALTRHDKLVVDDLPEKIQNFRSSQVFIGGQDPSELVPLEEIERRYILHVLDAADGNKTVASRILGLDRKTLYRKLRQYGADGNGNH
ncbi:MAG: Fis family transcriptional regulator [Planctomycetaceae bacterium]|nr:Fis family transcriptional regulator [Planctomycetaceae bacterium]